MFLCFTLCHRCKLQPALGPGCGRGTSAINPARKIQTACRHDCAIFNLFSMTCLFSAGLHHLVKAPAVSALRTAGRAVQGRLNRKVREETLRKNPFDQLHCSYVESFSPLFVLRPLCLYFACSCVGFETFFLENLGSWPSGRFADPVMQSCSFIFIYLLFFL